MPRRKVIPDVRFHLKNTNSDKPTPINLSFSYLHGRLKYPSGKSILPGDWDTAKQRMKVTHLNKEEAILFNEELDTLKNKTIEIFKRYDLGKLSIEQFKKELDGDQEIMLKKGAGFFKVIQDLIKTKETNPEIDDKSINVERTWLKNLQRFEEWRKRKVYWDAIDENFFEDFKNWCLLEEDYSLSHTHKGINKLKEFIRYARKKKVTKNDVLDIIGKFQVKLLKTNKLVLYVDEVRQLYNFDFGGSEHLVRARDIFIIGVFTGMRYSDYRRINKDLILEFEGEKFIQVYTEKTDDLVTIPLFEELRTVLEKYDYQTPKLSEQRFNKQIKNACKVAGIHKNFIWRTTNGGKLLKTIVKKCDKISSHCARRSFATNMTLLGFPAYMLMAITGHSTEKQFRAYVNLEGQLNAQRVSKIYNKIKKET